MDLTELRAQMEEHKALSEFTELNLSASMNRHSNMASTFMPELNVNSTNNSRFNRFLVEVINEQAEKILLAVRAKSLANMKVEKDNTLNTIETLRVEITKV